MLELRLSEDRFPATFYGYFEDTGELAWTRTVIEGQLLNIPSFYPRTVMVHGEFSDGCTATMTTTGVERYYDPVLVLLAAINAEDDE